MYKILFSSAAERYFKKLKDKQLRLKFKDAFILIQSDPYIGQAKHGDLSGIYGYDVYYNKTNYEIAYSIFEADNKKVVVLLAGTRENFYQELKRYANKG
ncbi:mRNA interferase RelE/StbE [Sporomusaceae bacterium BoRhaA]|uniref:type II toxin-antitoxin system RelE/ParE family toxin n=1 Tax=Pelorhabdus rhamnosifermentans TaxID=2772457 RepID=UPI001C062DBF|nr:type II toxin-antitoxin system RelE/ParE family toxin [Pelorhabdus rhamnosifermentans]MBU2702448.1 mRNA interferase RelE/StbE [Pelorhabdus rhamnosifermentans]